MFLPTLSDINTLLFLSVFKWCEAIACSIFKALKISVTGTRSPRETKNVPASVTVIDKNEIDRRGITDFRELFKYDAGVSIKSDDWRYTNSKGQNNINIRGMEDDRVLLLRDNINLPKRYDFDGAYTLGRGDYVDFNTLKSIANIEDGRVRNKIINDLDKEIPHFKELGKKIREAN